ncbi:MAG: DUF2975 domain-containing protein [Oscillibacter sp.]
MSNSTVQILARVLRVLLIFALLLNVLALLLVPASVMVNAENLFGGAGTFLHDLFHPEADDVTAAGVSAIFLSWVWIWGEGANALIALFLVICGICTALILLQGLRVLGTILQGAPFSTQNAVSLRRAAVCSFCIAGVALAPDDLGAVVLPVPSAPWPPTTRSLCRSSPCSACCAW